MEQKATAADGAGGEAIRPEGRDTADLALVVDSSAPEPPYEQLRAQVAEQVRSGALPVGYRLPTVRRLAQELGLAANTVAKTYRALETDGVIETRGRNGTFVAAAGDAADRELARAAQAFAGRALRLGVGHADAWAAAEDALRAAYRS